MQTLISSKIRKKILNLLLDKPEKAIGVREAASACRTSPASVSILLSSLRKEGLLKKGKLNIDDPEVRSLKVMSNIERLKPAFKLLRKKYSDLSMGVYGSWAKGTNTSASDIDIWIVTKKLLDQLESAEIRNALRKSIGKIEVSIVFLTKAKLKELMEKDKVFYCTLFHSFLIGGESIA